MTGILNILAGALGVAKDAYFNLVSLLLPGNGTNGAQNNTFLDSSGNTFTITRNGNTTQGTFSPFSQTGWGNRFGGTVDYITAADSADFDIGSSNFCIECWFWFESRESYSSVIGQWASGQKNFKFGFLTTDALTFTYSTNGTNETDLAQTGTLSTNSWHHIVACRSGTGTNQFAIFIDGNRVHNSTLSATLFNSSAALGIGGDATGACVGGYISNARVVVGSAVYDPTLSTLTVPTSPLTAITNTKLLTCQSNRFIDTNTQVAAKTITVNGSPSVVAFSPFAPTAAYTTAAVGGSGYFDGTGDYLTAPNNTALDLSTGDFTVECWFYPTSFSSTSSLVYRYNGNYTTGNDFQYAIAVNTSGSVIVRPYQGTTDFTLNAGTAVLNTWNHIALVRTGNTFWGFVNGNRSASSQTISGALNNSTWATTIGAALSGTLGNSYATGYIADTRILKGTALYTTSTYTVPTAPLTAITNTSLLLNFTNAGVVDATAKNVLETVGNAQISTSVSKFGGGSMSFDGNGDYLLFPASNLYRFGTGPLTVEFWFYPLSSLTNAGIVDMRASSASNTGLVIRQGDGSSSGTVIYCWLGNPASTTAATQTGLNTNQWNHIAVVRDNSNNLTVYVNGSGGTPVARSIDLTDTNCLVGAFNGATSSPNAINGYIDDLRISRMARYTANFTAPTAPFPVQ